MIAINLHKKTIRVSSVDASISHSERETFVELSDFWRKNPYISLPQPFGYDEAQGCIFVAEGWEYNYMNIHGEFLNAEFAHRGVVNPVRTV